MYIFALTENTTSPGTEGAEHHMNGEEQAQFQDAEMEEGIALRLYVPLIQVIKFLYIKNCL